MDVRITLPKSSDLNLYARATAIANKEVSTFLREYEKRVFPISSRRSSGFLPRNNVNARLDDVDGITRASNTGHARLLRHATDYTDMLNDYFSDPLFRTRLIKSRRHVED